MAPKDKEHLNGHEPNEEDQMDMHIEHLVSAVRNLDGLYGAKFAMPEREAALAQMIVGLMFRDPKNLMHMRCLLVSIMAEIITSDDLPEGHQRMPELLKRIQTFTQGVSEGGSRVIDGFLRMSRLYRQGVQGEEGLLMLLLSLVGSFEANEMQTSVPDPNPSTKEH